MKWSPIFEKDGLEFVVPYASMVGDSEDEAFKIAMGAMLIDGVLLGFKATNPVRYLELDDDGKAHVTGWNAKMGLWDVVILDTAKEPVS
ncbi:hypothetical protein LCGC14_1592700 [marine sediment metagenome]|uniref:Uncharacterized protein n=1 Tax=marine sediment metagenome TaxID=412755 RepID=A0A0F9LE00_9ZZZZ